MTAPKTPQIIGVDLIRYMAACIVVLFHLCFWIWAGRPGGMGFNVAKLPIQFHELAFLRVGAVGVNVFFVISGFIIAYSAQKSTAYEFFRNRVVRLMPAIWIIAPITLAVLFLVKFAAPANLIERFINSILLLPFGPWVDEVYWTLPIEVAFYTLVFGLLLIDRFRWLERAMAVSGLASSAFWIAKALGHDVTPNIPGISARYIESFMQLSLIHFGCFFSLGVFLWLSLLNRISFSRCVLMVCFTVGCITNIHGKGSCAIWLLAVIGIVFSVRFNSLLSANRKVVRLARVLGLATYPMYLWHDVIGAALIGLLLRFGVNRYVALIIAIGFVMSSTMVIAISVEPKLQKWLRSKIDQLSASFALSH